MAGLVNLGQSALDCTVGLLGEQVGSDFGGQVPHALNAVAGAQVQVESELEREWRDVPGREQQAIEK